MAAIDPTTTEQELEQAFRDDAEFALALLHENFRHQIGRYIKSVAWGLPQGWSEVRYGHIVSRSGRSGHIGVQRVTTKTAALKL